MKEGIESLGRIRTQGMALLVAAFVAGLLGGAAAERVMNSRRAMNRFLPLPAERGAFMPGDRPTSALERLNLTSDQRSAIDAILERRRQLTDSLFGLFLPQMRATADSMRREIRRVLTPDQQAELDRWLPPEGFGAGFMAPFGPPARSFRAPPGRSSDSIARVPRLPPDSPDGRRRI